MEHFHNLEITDVRAETSEAVSIAFDVPDKLKDAYRFVPGQYLTLKTTLEGEDLKRTYSICSIEEEGELRVAIKAMPQGKFSTYANEQIQAGDVIEVMTPAGRFRAPEPTGSHRKLVGFAGGSGITPFISIIRAVLGREPETEFTLFYGNRTRQSIIFRELLEDLKDTYLGRFRLFHVLSEQQRKVPLMSGMLDEEKCGLFLDALCDVEQAAAFLVSGPNEMVKAARAALKARGVTRDRMGFELFGPQNASRQPPQNGGEPSSPTAAGHDATTVIAILQGEKTSFPLALDGVSLLDAGLAYGLDLPFSCKGGVCCTCKAKLLEGEVDMAVNYGLDDRELEEGYILTCQSRPTTRTIVIDYDG